MIPSPPRQLLILSLLLGTASLACALASRRAEEPNEVGSEYVHGDYVGEVESDGDMRAYRLHVPVGYDSTLPTPLVFNFHGLGGSAEAEERLSGMSAKADEAGFIVVYPEGEMLGNYQGWQVGPGPRGQREVQFVRDLIAHLQAELNIDPDRIYATGISNGGGMVNRLGCDLSDSIAAIAPVAGANLFTEVCDPVRPMPVVAFHGTADQVVPYEGKEPNLPPIPEWAATWAGRNGCAPDATSTFDDGPVSALTWDNCDDNATVTLYTIEGGGHTWPGGSRTPGDFDATEVMWAFFEAHPMP